MLRGCKRSDCVQEARQVPCVSAPKLMDSFGRASSLFDDAR